MAAAKSVFNVQKDVTVFMVSTSEMSYLDRLLKATTCWDSLAIEAIPSHVTEKSTAIHNPKDPSSVSSVFGPFFHPL
jgi:hypothetical protein